MASTIWENIPELKTSAMLLAPTLAEHYKVLAGYFDPKLDKILDVGQGDGTFSQLIPNSTGVDESSDLLNYDLSSFNTLHFSESIGYINPEVLERLISAPTIKKIILKDFMCDDKLDIKYFSFDVSTLKKIVLPLLTKYGYNYNIKEFMPFRDRWKLLLKKYNMTYEPYVTVRPVVVVANR